MHWLLEYHYGPDILERRVPHRPAHLELLEAAHERGELVIVGVVGDPVDRAVFVWAGERDAVEAFVAADPYGHAGLVERWEISPYTVAVGG